jgi:hypothetical protein
MALRDIAVLVTVTDSSGNSTTQGVNVKEQVPATVAGGYYLSGNGDMRADTTNQNMNLKSFTQYRSLADGSTFPGWQKDYLKTYISNGILGNFVLELKHYGVTNQNAQTFTVEGQTYTVPAPNMTIQQRVGQSWPKAYGYDQVTSGQINGLLHRAVAQLKAMPTTGAINIQLASEFDTDHEFGTTENGVGYTWIESDSRSLVAIEYIIDYFRNYGIGQHVTFSIGMAGFNRAAFKRMHPEYLMSRINYMQFNCYRRTAVQTAYDVFKRTKAWLDADLGPLAKAKNIIVAEWGTPSVLADQVTWIRTVPTAIQRLNTEATGGKFIATNYFNSNIDWGTLSPKQAGLDALKEIYGSTPYA